MVLDFLVNYQLGLYDELVKEFRIGLLLNLTNDLSNVIIRIGKLCIFAEILKNEKGYELLKSSARFNPKFNIGFI